MVSPSDLSVSSGEDPDTIAQQTTTLVDNGRWRLWNNGKGIERTIKFKTFKTTWVLPSHSSPPFLCPTTNTAPRIS